MNENPQISMVMRVVKFITMLKYILYRDLPKHVDGDAYEEEDSEGELLDDSAQEAFEVILRKAIANQLPDDLEGNQDLAELIRLTYYESLGIDIEDVEDEAEHISDN